MQTYTILMHACMLKKKRRREIGEIFFLKKTIVIWTLILKTNGIGQSSIHQMYK